MEKFACIRGRKSINLHSRTWLSFVALIKKCSLSRLLVELQDIELVEFAIPILLAVPKLSATDVQYHKQKVKLVMLCNKH